MTAASLSHSLPNQTGSRMPAFNSCLLCLYQDDVMASLPSSYAAFAVSTGTTVILDVSTPELYALVIQGSLKFDTSVSKAVHCTR
jgi:hypothetical protein